MSQSHSEAPHRPTDRRKSPRLPARGRLLACLLEADRPVRIREIGFGGFATETIEPLPLSVLHEVRFTAEDDQTAVIPAVSMHSWPSCASDGTPCFVTGFEFRPNHPAEAENAVKKLIEKVTSVGLYGND